MATNEAEVLALMASTKEDPLAKAKAHIAQCEARTQMYVGAIKAAIPRTLNHTNLVIKSRYTTLRNDGASAVIYARKQAGKVRDIYDDGEHLVLVTTDRLTAFDRPIANIPGKGMVLNLISAFWFRELAQTGLFKGVEPMPSHFIQTPHPNVTIGTKAIPFKVEFVVRAYLTGTTSTSILTHYKNGVRDFCGNKLAEGMTDHQKLPEIIITPTTKSDEHDESLTPQQIVEQGLMTQDEWEYCSLMAIKLFEAASKIAAEKGLILVDTKLEMGKTPDGQIILIDEVFTPDSSRYWLAEGASDAIARGECPKNIDKEFLRKKLSSQKQAIMDGAPAVVAEEDIIETSRRYILLYEIITGQQFCTADLTAMPGLQAAVQGALETMYTPSPLMPTATVLSFAFAAPPKNLRLAELAEPAPAPKDKGREKYTSALAGRYVTDAMSKIWSDDRKFGLWRKMWATLARTQMELGIKEVTLAQVLELEAAVDLPIDYAFAAKKEKDLKHDVTAHNKTLCVVCPTAAPIIHLGATSCDITDNAELIQIKEAMTLSLNNGLNVLNALREAALKYKDVITLGYTHGQPAQLTTVGKRICMWAESLQIALENLEIQIKRLKLRGFKGTTGTQATLLDLFKGDESKIDELEDILCAKLEFEGTLDATGQTYHRNVDHFILSAVAGVSVAVAKMCEDIRLLASHKEMGEPFEDKQIGSSAMAYKQNPMRCERADGLNRVLLGLTQQPAMTASTQWLERSLDDSANRRIAIADSFMLLDAVLLIAANIVPGLRVNKGVVNRRVNEELPFMATERIMLNSVSAGGNRQDIHEAIREHSVQVAREVNEEGKPNTLIARICADERFPQSVRDVLMVQTLDPKDFVGRAPKQVEIYCAKVEKFLNQHGFKKSSANRPELNV